MGTIERHNAGTKFPVDAEHLHRYVFSCNYVKGKTVLDLACGEGYGSNIMSKYATAVTGMDVDLNSISQAKLSYNKANLCFKVGKLEQIPANDNSFDVIVSFETLEHITNHEGALAEIKRVLNPSGLLIMSTPNKLEYSDKPAYKNPFHLKELYRDEYENLLSAHFANVSILSQKFYHASFITQDSPVNAPVNIYYGSPPELKSKNPCEEAVFFIALASDLSFPSPSLSLFDLSEGIRTNHQQEIRALYQSKSYRIGNFFVRAASLFMKK